MAERDKGGTTSLEELIVSGLATTDTLAKLLIGKGLITESELMAKLSAGRASYQALLERLRR